MRKDVSYLEGIPVILLSPEAGQEDSPDDNQQVGQF